MAFVGNLLWFVFGGGLLLGLSWLLVGLIWCITVVGIPIGIACFRIAGFAFFPFGKELVSAEMVGEKRIAGTGIMNFFWCAFSGLWLAIAHVLVGVADCITIVGIPFGLANFKIAGAAFAPLGKRAVSKAMATEARSREAKAILDAKTTGAAIMVALLSLATGCASFEETLAKADGGDAVAMYSVGQAYANRGDAQNDMVAKVENMAKAEEYYQKSANLGNTKAKRALYLLWLKRGNTAKVDDIVSGFPQVAESGLLTFGLDVDLLNAAPGFCSALIRKGETDSFKPFVDMVVSLATHNFYLEDGRLEHDENFLKFRREMAPIEMRYREVVAEAERIAREKAEAERKAREEAERKAREEAERKAREEAERKAREEAAEAERKAWVAAAEAERKAREEAELKEREAAEAERKAREEAEKEWLAQKDDADFKFPLHDSFPDSTKVYREIRTGASLSWCSKYISHEHFSKITFSASKHEDYFNPTNISFIDGTRTINLDFGMADAGESLVLIAAQIEFSKGDVSVESLVEKYSNDLTGAVFSSTEEETSSGGGVLFGVPLPQLTQKESVSSFTTEKATVNVTALKGVAIAMGEHCIDENGKYQGPAGEIITDVLQTGYSLLGGQLDMELAGKAIGLWKEANETRGVPTVEITDTALLAATTKACSNARQKKIEEERRQEEEADRKRKEEEAQRANSF